MRKRINKLATRKLLIGTTCAGWCMYQWLKPHSPIYFTRIGINSIFLLSTTKGDMKEEELVVVLGEEVTTVEGDGWVAGLAAVGVSKHKALLNLRALKNGEEERPGIML